MNQSFQHPAEGMGVAAVAAFDRLCISQEPEASRRTMDTLVSAGLVEKIGERVVAWDCLGAITVPLYTVPYRYHIAWCQWGSRTVNREGL